jgi:hypothetical protein
MATATRSSIKLKPLGEWTLFGDFKTVTALPLIPMMESNMALPF